MRAHVEVDTAVKFTCLDMALLLREEWNGTCEIQVAGKAPLFVVLFAIHIWLLMLSVRPRAPFQSLKDYKVSGRQDQFGPPQDGGHL
jgi:hypothetical protein